MMNVIEYLSKQSANLLITVGIILVALVGLFDYLAGQEVGFSLFFLLPISLTTWFIGIRPGILISFASATTWLIVDLLKAKSYPDLFIPYWNAFIRLSFFLVIVLLQNSLKREQFLARTDSLTDVGNRKHFFELSDIEIRRAQRYNRPFTVAYLDIDNFKTINDNFGHNTGDTLLKVVAKTIKNSIRTTDVVARLGGDEFALILPETKSESAKIIINKLYELLLNEMEKKKWPVTFSIGVATFMSPPDSIDEMIKIVDNVMYASKSRGKNLITYNIFEK